MADFGSVIDGLDVVADIYDFHPEVPHLHRDWAHPATSAPGLGSPLRPTPRCRRSGPQRGHLRVELCTRISSRMPARRRLIRCNPSPQVWKSTESVGWEKMVLPGKVVPFS